MLDLLAFQTRARTIDHLGREQIADCPTAISELWKNAYDAYARVVELHIFDGAVPIALLADDGHGMSKSEFVDKWLVVGTESKASGLEVDLSDQNGLPYRERQGQKGIGRLSSAALGPLLLVVSKRKGNLFVAALIDWRLFENPFLYLHDVEIPVVEFEHRSELLPLVATMADKLMGNIWGDGKDEARDQRLASSWARLDAMNVSEGRPLLREAIESAILNAVFEERHFEQWPAWKDGQCGTALIVADISFDLEAQLPSRSDTSTYQTAVQAKNRLLETLSNFMDPFIDRRQIAEDSDEEFNYSVVVWEGSLSRIVVSRERTFMLEDLEDLEHVVIGKIDINGIFSGRVKAFGNWVNGTVVLPPKSPVPTRAGSAVGAFEFCLGTFEQAATSSSHDSEVHSKLEEQAVRYAGLKIYRNSLRVMPYGREDSDFFEIEKRRSYHAGREFWSMRRVFGRVALTRQGNPNLKDKAGREGLIDNRSTKSFRDIVENILMVTARRYFGTDSNLRKELLPEIKAIRGKEAAEAARSQVKSRRRKEFRKNLTDFLSPMDVIFQEVEAVANSARNGTLPTDHSALVSIRDRITSIKQLRSDMTLGTAPNSLGSLEDAYLEYRNRYVRTGELITLVSDSLSNAMLIAKPHSEREIAASELSRNAVFLQNRLRKWSSECRSILSSELARIADFVEARNKSYHLEALPYLDDLEKDLIKLSVCLERLEATREKQDQQNADFLQSYLATLRSLEESIDIESLVSESIDETDKLQEEIVRLNSLAQLGITVEIVGHEIEGLDNSIVRSLKEMSGQTKLTTSYQNLLAAHEALSTRLKFLSPLKLSGEKSRIWISGQQIFDYCLDFLELSLKSNGVNLICTEKFRKIRIHEQLSRIMPVFINLVNNSIYWVGQRDGSTREVLLDTDEKEVFVSDDGPGIESADVKSLFSLFFTRKTRGGRGVGLYLCRSNLAVGGSTIRYVEAKAEKRLPGANFAILFRAVENG